MGLGHRAGPRQSVVERLAIVGHERSLRASQRGPQGTARRRDSFRRLRLGQRDLAEIDAERRRETETCLTLDRHRHLRSVGADDEREARIRCSGERQEHRDPEHQESDPTAVPLLFSH